MPDNPDIERALKDLTGRIPRYRLYEQYFDGHHRLSFATEKFRNAFGELFRAFADNNCPAVIDPIADRLDVQGFTVEIGPEEASEAVWDIWQTNRMDQRSGEVHLEALRAGDAYVIVWPDESGQPVIYPQRAVAVTVGYDDEAIDQINWAAKAWVTDDNYVRLTMYYPDRIEKYVTRNSSSSRTIPDRGGDFIEYRPEREVWPLPNEYGEVPVFHFPNNSDIGHWGRSELANVIPIQDALNKSVADMLVAMEYVALPQRWATGVEVQIDEATGKVIPPFETGVDRIFATSNEATKFGQFAAADLTQFLEVQDNFTLKIARVSGTPAHYMMLDPGSFPSGEAMKTAEARFVAKVRDRQIAFGNAWESAMQFALRIAGGPEDVQLSATWNDPAPRSDRDHIEQLVRKHVELGVPRAQVWREAGYTDDQIERMETELEVTDAMQGERLRRYVAAGGVDREL